MIRKYICMLITFSMLIYIANISALANTEISPEADFVENSWRYQDGERMSSEETDSMQDFEDYSVALFSTPTMHGIDVSKHNGVINWGNVKGNIDYAIIRCGYGQNYTNQDDTQWYNNVQGCINNGIPFGVYLYSYATSTAAAKSEAEHVLRLVKGYNLQFPIYYDMEDEKTQGKCSTSQLGEIARTFCNTITNAGYSVGIYANKNWWTTKLTSSVFDNSNWSKWVAQYNSSCTYKGSYDMWQYTSSGRVDGISGNVDKNYWYNSVGPVVPSEPMTISNIRYENFDDGGFNILCDVTGAVNVLFPTWTTGDQSDIIWEECEFDGHTANCRINVSAYNGNRGRYITHIYAYNNTGDSYSVEAGSIIWPDKESPELTDIKVSDVSPSGYTITCNISDINGISRIRGATWNDSIGREPEYGGTAEGKTIWYDGVVNGTSATIRINSSDYENRIGAYTTHIWAWDNAGNPVSASVHATLPGIDTVPVKTIVNGNNVYSIFDVTLSWNNANLLAQNKGGHLITINSKEEQKIVEELMEYGSSAQYWIGGTDKDSEGVWKWVTNEGMEYSNWSSGEPNNANGVEHYAGVYSNGSWNDFQDEHSDIGYIMETEISGEPSAFIDNDGHYYYLYDNEVDWHGAKTFSEAMGGHLVTITDKKEQAYVQSLVSQGSDDFDSYFIGATNCEDGSTWKWVTDEKFDYTNWESGEPNTANNIEYYGEMYKSGKWNDRESFNNGSKDGFICEIETDDTYTAKTDYNGNTYLRIDKSLSWEDAKAYCEAMGGHLATITSEDEQKAVEDLLCRGINTLRSAYSIGGTDIDSEGDWKWITEEEFDYENWDSGEPNNGGGSSRGSQDYLTIYAKSDLFGKWDDNWNFNKNPYDIGFICEIEKKELSPDTPKPLITYGDVNCDGKINIIDIVLMRKYYANLPVDISEAGLEAADVNVDGKIDNKDILLMRKYVAKWNGIILGK